MRDDAQMIILSALVMALCLIGLMACVVSVQSPAVAATHSAYLSGDTLRNVLWAQDSGLSNAASMASIYSWPDRNKAADMFNRQSDTMSEELADNQLKHGVTCDLFFNDSLAGQYIAAHPGDGGVNIGGVLIKQASGKALVYGCAYDLTLSDGVTQYSVSRVRIF